MQGDLSQARKYTEFTHFGKEYRSNISVTSDICSAETKHQQALNDQKVFDTCDLHA